MEFTRPLYAGGLCSDSDPILADIILEKTIAQGTKKTTANQEFRRDGRDSVQQGIKLAFFVKGEQIVAAANVLVINENLRYGMAPCPGTHLLLKRGIVGHVIFSEVDIFDFQQLFGASTKRTVIFGVNFYLGHDG
jgi:hypothetical protein